MTTYNFDKVLVWDASPGGVMRLLRGGYVTVVDYNTGLDLFVQQSDNNGHATFTTVDAPVVTLRTPKGFQSEPITSSDAVLATATTVATDVATQVATDVAAQVASGDSHILLDTDGVPYFDLAGSGTRVLQTDTDGTPYFL